MVEIIVPIYIYCNLKMQLFSFIGANKCDFSHLLVPISGVFVIQVDSFYRSHPDNSFNFSELFQAPTGYFMLSIDNVVSKIVPVVVY